MIKMRTSTYYNGISYNMGETYKLAANIEKRWVKNGIAEAIPERNQPKSVNIQDLTEE